MSSCQNDNNRQQSNHAQHMHFIPTIMTVLLKTHIDQQYHARQLFFLPTALTIMTWTCTENVQQPPIQRPCSRASFTTQHAQHHSGDEHTELENIKALHTSKNTISEIMIKSALSMTQITMFCTSNVQNNYQHNTNNMSHTKNLFTFIASALLHTN